MENQTASSQVILLLLLLLAAATTATAAATDENVDALDDQHVDLLPNIESLDKLDANEVAGDNQVNKGGVKWHRVPGTNNGRSNSRNLDGRFQLKGEKGDPGPPGQCPSNCSDLIKNFTSINGQRCDCKPPAIDNARIRSLAAAELQKQLQRMGNLKGDKGEPGVCARSCSPGTATTAAAVRIISKERDLIRISRTLPSGSMVYSLESKRVMLKTAHATNSWVVLYEVTSSGRQLPKHTITPPPTTKEFQRGINGKLRLIALTTRMPGDMNFNNAFSIIGADSACQHEAGAYGFPANRFRAMIHGKYSRMDSLIEQQFKFTYQIVNYRGEQLYKNYAELLTSKPWSNSVQLQDFSGRNVTDTNGHPLLAWQGLRMQDNPLTHDTFTDDCDSYNSQDAAFTGQATDLMTHQLFGNIDVQCDARLVLLCVECPSFVARLRRG